MASRKVGLSTRVLSEADMELLERFEEQYAAVERRDARIRRAAKGRFTSAYQDQDFDGTAAYVEDLEKAQEMLISQRRALKQAQVECNL